MNNENSFNILKSLFLLIVAVSGNFVAETLGCKTQKLLTENMVAKQSVILLILYFTLSFFSSISPVKNMYNTLFIWIMYLLFTKMNIEFTMLAFLLLSTNYIIYTYVDFYKKNNKNPDMVKKLQYTFSLLNKFLIVFIIIGFLLYFKKQYSDHSGDWSTTKFIFGNVQCDSLK